jgi:hypothetical protein
MRNITNSLLFHGLVAAAVLGCHLPARAAEKPAVKPSAAPVVPKAIFIDDTLAGKDPFFPNSTRRQATIVRVEPTKNAAPSVDYLSLLRLQGISGLDGQKLALISGSTVAQGEIAEIRLSGQILKIRCREIRELSVVVELEDRSGIREIKLRDNI